MKIISMFNNINTKNLVLILFILAIIPPLATIIIQNPPITPGSDQVDYNQIATGLLEGRGFHCDSLQVGFIKMPTIRHPLYPFFIAIIYFFTNKSIMAVKLIQILINALICVIMFLIYKKLFKNRLASFGAGIAWAFYPLAISYSVLLLSETLATFLLVSSIWFILRYGENPTLKNSFLVGLFLGLTVLIKSLILSFIPLLFLWLILTFKDRLIFKMKRILIILFFLLVTISPWIIRNYIVFKKPFYVASGSGFSFYRYNNEKTLELINTPLREAFPFTQIQKEKISTLSEPQIDKYLYGLAWQFIKSHPKEFLKIRLAEFNYFWHLWPAMPKKFTEYYSNEQNTKIQQVFLDSFLENFINNFKSSYFLYFCKILYHLPYNILFVGMFISFFSSFKRDKNKLRESLLLFLLIATVNAVYVFHHGTDRYRMPIDPYVFILGFHGVALLLYALGKNNEKPA